MAKEREESVGGMSAAGSLLKGDEWRRFRRAEMNPRSGCGEYENKREGR